MREQVVRGQLPSPGLGSSEGGQGWIGPLALLLPLLSLGLETLKNLCKWPFSS